MIGSRNDIAALAPNHWWGNRSPLSLHWRPLRPPCEPQVTYSPLVRCVVGQQSIERSTLRLDDLGACNHRDTGDKDASAA